MSFSKHWKSIVIPLVVITGAIAYVAYRTRKVPKPRSRWKRFAEPDTQPLDASSCDALQGIYTVGDGEELFGKTAVLKWSYTVEEKETLYHLSLFCEKDGTYLLLTGRQQGNDILLGGDWRRAAANGIGLIRLVLQGGIDLLQNSGNKSFELKGLYGDGYKAPDKPLSFRYDRPLPKVAPLDIVAHRGGCRNVDFLNVSENTVDMTKMSARLGANGIEIDVRMTKDGVPVIFHDSFFSIHTIKHKLYGGLLHNHTLEEIKQLELRKGGRIPTLEEMLSCALYQTPLEVVWLDMKKECDIQKVRNLQHEYHQKAAAIGRTFRIYIGIPDTYMLDCFTKLDEYKKVPSLVELDVEKALAVDAEIWAPQYTNGFESDNVAKVHAAGKKAYVWSLDNRTMIDMFMNEGAFDGLVTNAAPVVVHWLYTTHVKELAENPQTV